MQLRNRAGLVKYVLLPAFSLFCFVFCLAISMLIVVPRRNTPFSFTTEYDVFSCIVQTHEGARLLTFDREGLEEFTSKHRDASFLIQQSDVAEVKARFNEKLREGERPVSVTPDPIANGRQKIEITVAYSTADTTYGYEATEKTIEPKYTRIFHMGHGLQALGLSLVMWALVYLAYRKIRYGRVGLRGPAFVSQLPV